MQHHVAENACKPLKVNVFWDFYITGSVYILRIYPYPTNINFAFKGFICLTPIFGMRVASVVSPKWLEFRRKGFWPPAKREGKSTAARRVAPKMALGFVASRSQVHGDMLPRRASPKAILGATKHQPFRRHYASI